MYQIMCDEYVLHDSRIDNLKVINAKCNLEVNKTGSLTFYIAPNHPYYDKINKHTSEITLYQDDTRLFSGRVLNDEINFNNIKSVECEGELSYLLDSIQRGKEYHLEGGTQNVIETYLTDILNIHNSQVNSEKQFTLGVVTVADTNNYLYKISNYENTLSIINSKLLDTYGGYFFVRHADNKRYIDYFAEFNNVSNQVISFGKNIVDMTKYIKGENIFTALIPLGATKDVDVEVAPMSEGDATYEKRLTISSVADSVDGTLVKTGDYIYDSEAVQKWGWIWKVQKWDDVTVAENLVTKGKSLLSNNINENLSIELTAIDLHLLDVNIDKISVGDKIQCVSIPHNVNTTMLVKSISIDIDNPQNTKIKLVSPSKTFINDTSISTGNKTNNNDISEVKEVLSEDYPTIADVDLKLDDFKGWTNTQLDDFKGWTGDNYLAQGTDPNIKNLDDIKNWVGENYTPLTSASGTTVDLGQYAKIVDVNNAFNQLASALNEV